MRPNNYFKLLKDNVKQQELAPKEKAAACAYQLLRAHELFHDQASHSTRWDRHLLFHEGFMQVMTGPEEFVDTIRRKTEDEESFIAYYTEYFGDKALAAIAEEKGTDANQLKAKTLLMMIKDLLPLYQQSKNNHAKAYLCILISDALQVLKDDFNHEQVKSFSNLRNSLVHPDQYRGPSLDPAELVKQLGSKLVVLVKNNTYKGHEQLDQIT